MKEKGSSLLLLLLLVLFLGPVGGEEEVTCYLGSWSVYRPGGGRFDVEDVDPGLCSTLVYAFVGLDPATNAIKSLDPEYDYNKKALERFVGLKALKEGLKVLVAVGGWTEGSTKYSTMASKEQSRRQFVQSAVDFVRKHGFDGLDLDWEYPSSRGGVPEDKENFVKLVQELRREFDKHGLVLTAAVAAGKSTVEQAYDVERLSREVDFLHVMAYDYHGRWDGKTGHNAPLYGREDEADEEAHLNVDSTVKLYLSLGAPREKVLLGVGLYGRSFLLRDASDPGLGSPARTTAFAGPYTREDGFLGYNEICEKQRTEPWSVVWQKGHQAPYMFLHDKWVGYDDAFSLGLKAAYAQKKGLAGLMVWSIDTDDFAGVCSKNSVRFPMLRAINQALSTHAEKRPTSTTQEPPKVDVDDDDDDVDVDLDVDNDLDDYKYEIDGDAIRTSKVDGKRKKKKKEEEEGKGRGSNKVDPAIIVILALLTTAFFNR